MPWVTWFFWKFFAANDMARVLARRPWIFDKHLLMEGAYVEPYKLHMNSIPFWVQNFKSMAFHWFILLNKLGKELVKQ